MSAADTAVNLLNIAQTPIYAVVRGKYNAYFGDEAFKNPRIVRRPPITRVAAKDRAVFFEDGTSIGDVDHIIFGTGYTWTLPFLPDLPLRNNRVPDLYLHIFYQGDPTLSFVGAVCFALFLSFSDRTQLIFFFFFFFPSFFLQVGAGLTFRIFEWQAVLAARVFAGKAHLPPLAEQQKWEQDRIAERGDGPPFTVVNPYFEEYFETVRRLAGNPQRGEPGRVLPRFDPAWVDTFNAGHERRKRMWRKKNDDAARELEEVRTKL